MYNTIYPVNIKPYVPPKNRQQVGASTDEPSKGSEAQKENRALQQSDNNNNNKQNYERQELPNGKKSTIDYTKSQVNIAQIITDFKNTAAAIGTPDYIVEEVDSYLKLAEIQSLKDQPNKKIIQANLKNASTILDDFISKTLNKNSKVVENWVDALFLQKVDYKSDPNTINPDFLVKLPDENNVKTPVTPQKSQEQAVPQNTAQGAQPAALQNAQTQPSQPAQTAVTAPASQEAVTAPIKESKVYIPQDPELKKAFIQGKKYFAANENSKALAAFTSALTQANEVNDKQAASMVCYEIGQIYDKEDNLDEALKYYNQALTNSSDYNLKARAYYSMAQIYNDVVYFEPAMNHYYAAISVAGEAENLTAQTKALTEIAQMYAERYDKETTKEYLTTAKMIALETKNNKTLGTVYSKSGDSMKMLEENVTALNDYKESAKYFEEADSPIKVAKNYEKASLVMSKLGNYAKAKTLMQKAYNIASTGNNNEYLQELAQKLTVF